MHSFFLLSMLLPVVIATTALAYSAHPRRGIVLGVSLPLEIATGEIAQNALRRYRTALGFVGLALIFALIALSLMGHTNAAALVNSIGIVVVLIVAFVLRAKEAEALKPYRVQAPLTRSAELNPHTSYASLGWGISALAPLMAAAIYLKLHWAEIPARWPRHWDAAGHANGWGVRAVGSVATPVVMGAFMVVVLLAILCMQYFAPGTDSTMRRKFCAPLAALAWLMSLGFTSIALTPVLHLGESAQVIFIGAHAAAILGVIVWAVVRSGVASAAASATDAPPYDGTPDDCWHAGLFYFNPNDAAVLVPKRFGWGWTLNFARPLSWVFMGAILIFSLVSLVLPKLLK